MKSCTNTNRSWLLDATSTPSVIMFYPRQSSIFYQAINKTLARMGTIICGISGNEAENLARKKSTQPIAVDWRSIKYCLI